VPPSLPSRRPLASASVLIVSSLVATMVAFGGDPAAGDLSADELEPIGVLVPDEQLDTRILALELAGAEYGRSVDVLEVSLFDREQTRRELELTTVEAGRLLRERLSLDREVKETRLELEQASTELTRTESELANRAVERFVRHGADWRSSLDPASSIAEAREARLSAEADGAQLERRSHLLTLIDQLEEAIESLETKLIFTDLARARTNDQVALLSESLVLIDAEIDEASTRLVSARRSARVAGFGIPVIALDAYLDTEMAMLVSDPGCGFRWWMVAGVARVESRHGEIGGRRLRADGRVNEPIIGVPLDGGPSVQLVMDTDGGRLDGDAEFDRAVGPLQFIPETWGRLGRDGNSDGIEDPQNVYDAALAAAEYLCQLGGDLGSESSLRAALHGYNSSWDYVDAVHRHALRFSGLELPARP
jgi:hypothetical protein